MNCFPCCTIIIFLSSMIYMAFLSSNFCPNFVRCLPAFTHEEPCIYFYSIMCDLSWRSSWPTYNFVLPSMRLMNSFSVQKKKGFEVMPSWNHSCVLWVRLCTSWLMCSVISGLNLFCSGDGFLYLNIFLFLS